MITKFVDKNLKVGTEEAWRYFFHYLTQLSRGDISVKKTINLSTYKPQDLTINGGMTTAIPVVYLNMLRTSGPRIASLLE